MWNRIAVVSLFVLAANCRTVEPEPPPEAPRITRFTADDAQLSLGGQTSLHYEVTGATKVEVIDDEGLPLMLSGTASSGMATVAPGRSTFYVLRATGAGGRDVAFVQVAVAAPLRDVFLVAVPAAIEAGGEAVLVWSAAGATEVTLSGSASSPRTLTGTAGAVTVKPTHDETFTLSARASAGGPKVEAIASVTVRPLLTDASLSAADGVRPGKSLMISWKSAGATRLTVTERNFGLLNEVTDPAVVASGSYGFTVPATLPNGVGVVDGTPFDFTVTASAGDETVSRSLHTVAGDAPVITLLDAPTDATTGRTFVVRWRTANATHVSVSAGGGAVFETLPGDTARAAEGRLNLSTPASTTDFTLTASNATGVSVSQTFSVRPVAPPTITSFTLPGSANTLGDSVQARWTTTNASSVVVRLQGGATLATVTTPSQVASGSAAVFIGTSATVVLEARNAAGAVATATQPFAFDGTVAVDPAFALRDDPVTFTWDFTAAGVTEVVGLALTPAPLAIPGSAAFVDLTARPTARTLSFADRADGMQELALPPGFVFPLLGRPQPRIWAGVNGLVTFAPQAVTSSQNVDLTGADGGVPTVLAPLWDDLQLGETGQLLTDLVQAPNGEQVFVIEWKSAELAGYTGTELTFEVQLYETGQVSFVYDTVTGTVDSATVGAAVVEQLVVQQYLYNDAAQAPVQGLELAFFTQGPPTGSVTLVADRSEQLSFFGRTSTQHIAFAPRIKAIAPGDVAVTEAMPLAPLTVPTTGQWVEVTNLTSWPLDVEGLALVVPGGSANGGYVFGPGATLAVGQAFVVGQSMDPLLNGGAPIDAVSDDLPLEVPGAVEVELNGATVSRLAWDAGTDGTSLQPAPQVLLPSGTPSCPRVVTYGNDTGVGTPGAPNEACAPYARAAIAGNFLDAPPGAGLALAAIDPALAATDEGVAVVPLPVPFTYFGTEYTRLTVSTNGTLAFGDELSGNISTNLVKPQLTSPLGTVAPFWDDLEFGQGALLAGFRHQDRYVVSWEHFRHFDYPGTDLNFQVHLRDDGVIEFHYGDLRGSTSGEQAIASGGSATAWLEAPTGQLAIFSSVNTPRSIVPFSGVRFTPVP